MLVKEETIGNVKAIADEIVLQLVRNGGESGFEDDPEHEIL